MTKSRKPTPGGQQSDKPPQPASETDQTNPPDADDKKNLQDLLDKMPPETAAKSSEIVMQAQFAGPLPPPALFREYDNVLPGAAERILSMTEKEQTHRHNWEVDALKYENGYSRLGLWLGAGALGINAEHGGI